MPWTCQECKKDIWVDDNMAMLKEELWLSIANKEDVLCDSCIEKRLGRKLKKEDLKPDVLCNIWYMQEHPLMEAKSFISNILKEAKGSNYLKKILYEAMLYTKARSSNIDKIGYDKETEILELEFKNGGVYQYFDVPIDVYKGLKSAPSQGKYAHSNIFGYYNYERTE
jgi:hypothetical protein